jgi:DNA gyrase/topoisomerase IV subunit A
VKARKDTSQLQAELRNVQSEAAELREQRAQLEQRLNQQGADLDRGAAERTELDKKLAATEASLQTLESKLDLTAEQNRQETAQFVEQQTHITELSASLRERDQKVTQDEQLLEHDRDIRNLMGARDLYIAEIYDVAKNGDTQKPFGRVFYTKGKSLIFYAYDLDQQPGVKRASTFQAWGRIGSDTKHDRNLGIFYQDDINKQRWILKSTDAKALSQIDAVFVTVEPNGESAKPSGKPLLFTYLRMTPNHP